MLLADDPYRCFVPYPPVPVPNAPGGPLAGLTLAVKDIYDVAGYRTGCGNPFVLARSDVKTRTAPAAQRLLDAGARFVGKTHTDELAFSMAGMNAHFGTPVNVAAPERIPGGSSSGSASAVAGRLADLGLGSDTGGSVRAPASYQRLFGIRPTWGRGPLDLTMPLAPSFDTPGLFARDAATLLAASRVLLGGDASPLPARPRVLLATDAFDLLDPAVRAALEPAVTRVEAALGRLAPAISAGDIGFDALYWAFRHLQGREAWDAHRALIERDRPPLGPGVKERFAFGRDVTDAQIATHQPVREAFATAFGKLLGADGVLVVPTVPDAAPLITESEEALDVFRNRALRLTCLSGLSGHPQVTMPLAHRLGAPLGLSLVGPRDSDLSLVALAGRIAGAAS